MAITMDKSLEQNIIRRLLLQSSMGMDVGLYHGKMGLILFFAYYYKHTSLQIYEDTADDLMTEFNEEIKKQQFPVGFASGLSDIGWGIEYLIQNGFMEDDSLEICEALDKKIMEKDLRRMIDFSLGLEGIIHSVLTQNKINTAMNVNEMKKEVTIR